MLKYFAAGAACLTLAACATPYQNMGFTGGVAAHQLTADTFQVTARGNGFTDPDRIQRYVLRKAAETTVAAGFDSFAIVSSQDRTGLASVSTGSATAYGRHAYGWGTTSMIVKPGETVLVKMLRGPKPGDAPPNVFDAREVLQFTAPDVAKR